MKSSNTIQSLGLIKYLWSYVSYEEIKRKRENKTFLSLSLAAATLLYTAYKYMIMSKTVSKKKQINGNHYTNKTIPIPKQSMYPYIGHMFSLGDLPAHRLSIWHKQLGPIVQLQMGIQTWISISDHELAHKVFVSNGVKTSYRPHSTYAYLYYSSKGK